MLPHKIICSIVNPLALVSLSYSLKANLKPFMQLARPLLIGDNVVASWDNSLIDRGASTLPDEWQTD